MKLWRDLSDRVAARVWLRLIMLLGTTLVAVSSLLLVLVLVFYNQRLNAAQDRAAQQLGGLLHAALENAMLKRDIPGLQAIIDDLAQEPMVGGVMILNPGRVVRFASDPARLGEVIPEDAPAPVRGVARAEHPVPNRAPCATCHGAPEGSPINGYLVVDHRIDHLARETWISAAGLVLLGGLATLTASGVLALGMRRIVGRPIAALSRATEAMADGDLGSRVAPAPGQDEVARLGHSFNRMAESIQAGQESLMRAERHSQALIDAIPDGIRVIGPDFRIRRANAAYADQVGRPLAEIIGQPCHLSSHGRDTPCPYTLVTCPLVEMRTQPRRLTLRDCHRAPAGRQMAVEVSAAPMEEGCVVEAIRNLDDEIRMSQSQRLSELGLLATGVAHEIHNPLSSVELALGAIGRDLAQGRTDRAQDYFGLIRAEIGKCLEITDNLLRLGSPSGRVRQLIGLDETVVGVMRLLTYQAEDNGIEVQRDIASDLRVLIGDSDLRMAITNLAMNAFHAMPEGGRLTLTGAREEGRVILRVADTGVGIPHANQTDIFMPFWSRRADDSTGRGLGLAITRAIVERAGASITVDSAPGRGSCFTLSFPDPDFSP